ncbi:hypothetical protein [Streptomyces sp. enrichment culture]|uniref:hypothetical protein n=1 Tax=Streptomyces sp. enrichment culture TaxID=1795815 RepID=UPI003F561F09
MTAQLGTPRGAPLPALNFSVTHVGLQTAQIESARREGQQVETTLATTRIVLLALNPVGGMREASQMKDFFNWPTWQAPGIPKPRPARRRTRRGTTDDHPQQRPHPGHRRDVADAADTGVRRFVHGSGR